jgi:hypothetical protein
MRKLDLTDEQMDRLWELYLQAKVVGAAVPDSVEWALGLETLPPPLSRWTRIKNWFKRTFGGLVV